jgi:hypothetical protein
MNVVCVTESVFLYKYTVLDTKPVGTRKIGRPKLRWEDDVIQDIKTLGVKNWEEFGNGKGKLANASEEGQGPRPR